MVADRIKLLFLAANPVDTARVQVDEEIHNVVERLRRNGREGRFEIETELAVRAADLPSTILRHRPDIVHFAGHGSESGELLFVDGPTGQIAPVSAETLSLVFKEVGEGITCVVLNACYSQKEAQAIATWVPCVVGMSRAVTDTAALSFAGGFYESLTLGLSIKSAWELGKLQPELNLRSGERDVPQLICRPGVDPAAIFLNPPAGKHRLLIGSAAGILILSLVGGPLAFGLRHGAPAPSLPPPFASGYDAPHRPPAVGTLPADMVLVSGGRFVMGSNAREIQEAANQCAAALAESAEKRHCESLVAREEPPRNVVLPPFLIDRAEVSGRQFHAFLQQVSAAEAGRLIVPGSAYFLQTSPDGSSLRTGEEEHPASGITWLGAHRYCQAQGRRLPTEAEWEFAARGPGRAPYPWGTAPPDCQKLVFARFAKLTCEKTAGPAGYTANPVSEVGPQDERRDSGLSSPVLGLAGNVAEWVADEFREGARSECCETSPRPAAGGCFRPLCDKPATDNVQRVVRGGSWQREAVFCRGATRSRMGATEAAIDVGFRCAMDLSAPGDAKPHSTQ